MKQNVSLWVLIAILFAGFHAGAQVFNWTTVAGLVGTPAYADGTNSTAFFNHPTGTAVDAAGNVYVADANNYVIRELSQSGGNWVSTTIAGLPRTSGSVDGTNSAARFSDLTAMQIDGAGNLYVFDNNLVRKIAPIGTNWVVTTIYNQNGGGWAFDSIGNFYTASNSAIIELTPGTNGVASPTNYVETVLAGFPGISGSVNGTNNVARFNNPFVFAADGTGTIYLTDNSALRKVVPVGGNWVVSTISANAYSSPFRDNAGNFYGANSYVIYQLPAASSNWMAIGGAYYSSGSANGTNNVASFANPQGISVDASGNVFLADYGNDTIRMGSVVPTGSLQVSLTPPGAVSAGAQWQVDGGAWETNGAVVTNLLVGNHTVSFSTNYGWTTPGNQVVTINSNQLTSITGVYTQLFGALEVTLNPASVVNAGAQWQVDGGAWQNSGVILSNISVGAHNLTFAPVPGWVTFSNVPVTVNNGLITVTNIAYTVAYNWSVIAGLANTPSYADGTNNSAFFNSPQGIAVDGAGNVYVADVNNNVIRRISPQGPNWVTTTIAGQAGNSGVVDGINNSSRFGSLGAIQMDGVGNLYVKDYGYYSGVGYATGIRKIYRVGTNWVTTTIYKLASQNSGWAIDAVGNFYTASNYSIIQLTPTTLNGVPSQTNFVTTVLAGFPGLSGGSDGTNIVARFSSPSVFGIDSSGTIHVTDNNGLRTVTPINGSWVTTTLNEPAYSWMTLDAAGNILGSSSQYLGYPSYTTYYNLEILWAGATNWAFFDTLSNFTTLSGVAVGANGEVYVADSGASVIRAGTSVSVQLGSLQVALQPSGAASSGAAWEVDGGGWQTNGATVTNLMVGSDHIISFASIYGWATPSNQWVTISNGVTTVLAENYIQQFGAVQVALTPSGATNAGAEWQVDGGPWQESGTTVSNLSVGIHTVSFINATGFITPSPQTNVVVVPNQTTVLAGNYIPLGAVQVNINPPGATNAGAQWQLDGGPWQNSGFVLTNVSLGSHTVSFLSASGWVTPGDVAITVNSGQTNAVDADYVVLGSLQVDISPAGAVSGGAQWQIDGGALEASGNSVSNLTTGVHTISFIGAIGYITPTNQTITINPGGTTTVSATYVALGAVQVSLNPPGAISAGAQWQLDGGTLQNSGAMVSNVSLGTHLISFVPVSGWITPSNLSITVTSGETNVQNVNYMVLGSLQVTILPLGAANGGAQWQVDSNGWQSSGSVFSNLNTGTHIISYSSATGYIAPTNQPVNINPGGTTALTTTYVALGTVITSINPTNAVNAGAQWALDGGGWQNSGTAVPNVPLGTHTISFLPTIGFITASNQTVNVVSGTNNFTANYIALGAVTASINPTNVVNAGAQWALDGGTWQNSGTVVSNVSLGIHTVSYLPVVGWITPSNQNVTTLSGATTNVSATYVALGNLHVTINPPNAASSGAQWQVDGGSWQNSGGTVSNLSLGTHTVSYSALGSWITPSNQVVTVVSGQTTNVSAVYVALGSLQVVINPIGVVSSGAVWRVDSNAWQISSAVVSNLVAGNHTVSFTNIYGWSTPANQTVAINLNQTTEVAGLYLQQFGNVQVILSPAGAVSSGAQWQLDNGAWQDSGATLTNATVANHTLGFSAITGWVSPASQIISVSSNQTTRVTATYQGQGSLQVFVLPTGAIVSGAQWQVDGGQWMCNGATVSGLGRGNHSVAYQPASGWVAPASQIVSILANQTTITNGAYTDLGYNFSTIAGLVGDEGYADGTNQTALFDSPVGIAVDGNGNLFIADTGNSVIRRLTPSQNGWISTTIAGFADSPGNSDGTNSQARFDYPSGVAVDASGNIYVADQVNSTIREITPQGTNWVVSTLAGFAGAYGSANGTNSAARFYYPAGLAVDSSGNIYVADQINSTIRKLTPLGSNNWAVTTIAGTVGANGSLDGTNNASRFYWPNDLTVDGGGNVYVADSGNYTIRKITPVGTNYITTTICGVAGNSGSVDGTNSGALFDGLGGITIDASGNLFLADSYSSTIRKITPVGTNWVVNTIGGLAYNTGFADGTNSVARFDMPYGVCVLGNGTLYIADTYNQTIRAGSATSQTPENPEIAISLPAKSTSFAWQAQVGLTYQVQFKTNLLQGPWFNLGSSILATNSAMSFVDTTASNAARFYRMEIMP